MTVKSGSIFFAVLFYVCLIVAAITSSVSIFEAVVAAMGDLHISRRTAVPVAFISIMVIGVFCTMSFGPLADDKWLGRTFFDWVDYLTSNISLPIGGLMIAVLSSWVAWPQVKPFICGEKSHLYSEGTYKILRWSIAIFAPILVLTVLFSGI